MNRQRLVAAYQPEVDPVALLEILCIYGQETAMPMHVLYSHCPPQLRQRHKISSLKALLGGMYSMLFAVERGTMGEDMIRAQRNIITLCEAHCSREGCKRQHVCDALHACRRFLRGVPCKFQMMCRHGHDLSTKHNAKVLFNAQLQGISLEALQQLIHLNDVRLGRAVGVDTHQTSQRRASSTGRNECSRASGMGVEDTGRKQQTNKQPSRRSASSTRCEQPHKAPGKKTISTPDTEQHAKYDNWKRNEGAARARTSSRDSHRASIGGPNITQNREGRAEGSIKAPPMGESQWSRNWPGKPRTSQYICDLEGWMGDRKPEVSSRTGSNPRRKRNPKRASMVPDTSEANDTPDSPIVGLEHSRTNRAKPAQTPYTLKICHFYNFKGGCQHGDSGEKCQALHICKHYLTGGCTFGDNCKRSHDIYATQPNTLLVRHGINMNRSENQILKQLRRICEGGNAKGSGTLEVGEHNDPVQRTPESSRDILSQVARIMLGETSRTQPSHTLQICHFYNFKGGCRFGETGQKCHALHICKHFLRGDCIFRDSCKRSHDILATQPRAVLVRHDINMNRSERHILAELQDIFADCMDDDNDTRYEAGHEHVPGSSGDTAEGITGDSPSACAYYDGYSEEEEGSSDEEDDGDDINVCMYNLIGKCAYGRSCHDYHCGQPYQWQYLGEETAHDQGPQWCDFIGSCNKEIELSYSNPSTTDCYSQLKSISGTSLTFKVNFEDMVVQWNKEHQSEVRRLGTRSHLSVPQSQKFTTRWCWYWQEEQEQWREYGEAPPGGVCSSVCSDDIERDYVKNNHGQITFNVGAATYAIKPFVMLQINLETGSERKVLNRPAYNDMSTWTTTRNSSKSKEQSKAGKECAVKSVDPNIPSTWHPDACSNNRDYQLVVIEKKGKTAREYNAVAELFMTTMPERTSITDISRVQNYDLWQAFTCKQRAMEMQGKSIHEKRLFHVTQPEYVEPICQEGFDLRMSGRSSGDLFGKGSYFARDAGYSKRFTTEGVMFLARTLVGDYIEGDPSYLRPPPTNPSRPDVDLYDSCVDDINNPMIYVIFSHDQAYPEYLITFSLPPKKTKSKAKKIMKQTTK